MLWNEWNEQDEKDIAYGDCYISGDDLEDVHPLDNCEEIDTSDKESDDGNSRSDTAEVDECEECEKIEPIDEDEEINSSCGDEAVIPSDEDGEALTFDECGESEEVGPGDRNERDMEATQIVIREHQQTSKGRYYTCGQ
jgi:hypothetical protein